MTFHCIGSPMSTLESINSSFARDFRVLITGGNNSNKFKYYTSNSNCPRKKHHLYHVTM